MSEPSEKTSVLPLDVKGLQTIAHPSLPDRLRRFFGHLFHPEDSFVLPSEQRDQRKDKLEQLGKHRAQLFRKRAERKEQLQRCLELERQRAVCDEAGLVDIETEHELQQQQQQGQLQPDESPIDMAITSPIGTLDTKSSISDVAATATSSLVMELGDAALHLAEQPTAAPQISRGHSRSSSQDALTGFNEFSYRVADEFKHGLPSIRRSLSELSIVSLNSVDGPTSMKKNFCDFTDEEKQAVREIIVDLCYALAIYGVPTYRLEHHMQQVASFYGIDLYVAALPTCIWVSFGAPTNIESKTTIIKINGTDTNLHKLCEVDGLADSIAAGKCNVLEAREQISSILKQANLYSGFFWTVFSFIIASGSFCVLLDGTWLEMTAALVAGFFIGIWTYVSGKYAALGVISNLGAALIAGVVGLAFKMSFAAFFPQLQVRCMVFLISIAGIFNQLPGWTITLSVAELATRNLTAGTSRLMGAAVTCVQLAFGILITAMLSQQADISIDDDTLNVNHIGAYALALPVVVIALMIGMQVPRFPLALLFCFIAAYSAFFITFFGARLIGPSFGSFVASFVVTTLSNIYARLSKHPAIVISATATILLVPGSIGVRSVKALLIDRDPLLSSTYLIRVIETAGSIVFGLLLGEYVFPVRWRLRIQAWILG